MFVAPFLVPVVLSPAEEAWRHQQKICGHVELCGVTVGAGDQRGALCRPLTHGDRHEGKWAQDLSSPQAHTASLQQHICIPRRYRTKHRAAKISPSFYSSRLPPFLRWLSKVFGQPFHRGSPLTSVSWWGSAWTKTRPRDPSSTWSSRSWRRCRTSERLRSSLYTPCFLSSNHSLPSLQSRTC